MDNPAGRAGPTPSLPGGFVGNRLVATGVLDVPLMGGDRSYDRIYSEVGGPLFVDAHHVGGRGCTSGRRFPARVKGSAHAGCTREGPAASGGRYSCPDRNPRVGLCRQHLHDQPARILARRTCGRRGPGPGTHRSAVKGRRCAGENHA